MTDHEPVATASARIESIAAGSTDARTPSTVVPSQLGIQLPPTRVRIEISSEFLNSCHIHQDWAKFWFLVPEEVYTVAEMLAALWRLLLIDVNPQVKLSCQGFYIPTSSSVKILREGDIVLVQLWSEEVTGDLPTNLETIGKALAPKTPTPKSKQVALNTNQQPSGAPPAEVSKVTRTGPSRNARRKKLKRQLRREGILPSKTPKPPQAAESPAHASTEDAQARDPAAAVGKNGTQRCVSTTPYTTQPRSASAAGKGATIRSAAHASLHVENRNSTANAGRNAGIKGSRKRSRQDEDACQFNASAKGTTVPEQNTQGVATWTDFLNRTTAGNSTAPQQHHSKTPLIQKQVAQESSSSDEASSEEGSSENEDSSEASSEHEDAAPNGKRQVQAVGGLLTGTHQPVSKTKGAKSAAGNESSSEEETDDSSDEESESEDSSSSEEDQGSAAKKKEGAAELAAIAAQAANTCGMAGSVVPGKGAGQAREAEGAGGGLQVPGSKAKQGSVTKTQQDQDEEMEGSDASGRFASAVEPWLAAQSNSQNSQGKSEHMTSPATQVQQHTHFRDKMKGTGIKTMYTDQELRQLIAATDTKDDLVRNGGVLPAEIVEGCVLMYQVAELNSACMPSVSGWRLGRVHNTTDTTCTSQAGDPAGTELQMAPWPDEAVHPLRRAWGEAVASCEQATCTGKGRGRNLDSDEVCDAWVHGSMHYDPLTGWFSGLWAMDIVNAKLVHPAGPHTLATGRPTTGGNDQEPHSTNSNAHLLSSERLQQSVAGPSCEGALPGPPVAPAAGCNAMGSSDAANHLHSRAVEANVQNETQEALKGSTHSDVPVATVQPGAEASLAEALSLLDGKPAKQRKHRQRKKHNDRAAGGTPPTKQQGWHIASAVASEPLTPTLGVGLPHGTGSNTAPVGHGTQAPTPPMSSAAPHRSPQDLLQALQQLEERKAEPLKSSQLVEAAERTEAQGPKHHDKGIGLESTATDGEADSVPNADKRQRSHSADVQKAEHGGRTMKARGARQALGGRRQSAMAPTLKLLRQSPSSLTT